MPARAASSPFHLGGCSNCAISESHTIGAISDDYGIPLPMLLESLNALFDQTRSRSATTSASPTRSARRFRNWPSVPEVGEIIGAEGGAYTADFGDVRLQGLAEDFIVVPAEAAASLKLATGGEALVHAVPVGNGGLA